MDHQIIEQNKHSVRLQFNASKTFTPEQKHKLQQAIDQFMLKTKAQRKKLENRVKRIIKEETQ